MIKLLFDIFDKKQRYTIFVFLILMLVGAVFEMLGVGLIMPVMAIILSPSIVESYPSAAPLVGYLGNPEKNELILIALGSLITVYLLKMFVLSYVVYRQSKIITQLQSELAKKLYDHYLNSDYMFHVAHNSAQLIRNITVEVGICVNNVLAPFLRLFMEILVIAGLLVILFNIEALGTTIIVTVIAMFSLLVLGFTKRNLKRWSLERQYHDGMILQHIQQSLNGIKDVKLHASEHYCLKLFDKHVVRKNILAMYQAILSQIPKLVLEFIMISSVVLLVFILINRNSTIEEMMAILATFSVAAMRLMPSANKMIHNLNVYRYGKSALDVVLNALSTSDVIDDRKLISSNEPALSIGTGISIDNISYTYPGETNQAISSLNLEIKKGAAVAFIGESGSGKSTIVDMILGLISPTSGEVKVDGLSIKNVMTAWQSNIGYVPQNIYLTDDTLRNNIAFGLHNEEIDEEKINIAIQHAQLKDFVNSQSAGLDTVVGEKGARLSGGQIQRIGIARALYREPSVLILDEATSALDNLTEKSIMDTVMRLKGQKTIIIVAHRLTTVQYCDHIFKIRSGKLVDSGTFDQVVN